MRNKKTIFSIFLVLAIFYVVPFIANPLKFFLLIDPQFKYDVLSTNLSFVGIVTSEIVDSFVDDKDETIRRLVAKNCLTSEKNLEKLAKDTDYVVRMNIAKNPNTPNNAKIILSKDSVKYVQACCSETPKEILVELSKEQDKIMWHLLAENNSTPPEVLEKLSTFMPKEPLPSGHFYTSNLQNDWKIIVAISENLNCPASVLDKLAKSRIIDALSNPNISAESLEKFSCSESEYERQRVAKNPKAPLAVLSKLAKDPHGYVREAVAKNEQTPQEILHHLALDIDRDVREAAMKNKNWASK